MLDQQLAQLPTPAIAMRIPVLSVMVSLCLSTCSIDYASSSFGLLQTPLVHT